MGTRIQRGGAVGAEPVRLVRRGLLQRAGESFTADGWLRTGDVAVVDPKGRIRLVDRTKDLIKSGGEWISSVDVENELMAHPKIKEAAVIGVPHPRWAERPLACIVPKDGETVTKDDVIEFLTPRLAKWQLPDDVVFIDEVPKTSVGKFSKKTLRDRFADPRRTRIEEGADVGEDGGTGGTPAFAAQEVTVAVTRGGTAKVTTRRRATPALTSAADPVVAVVPAVAVVSASA